MKYTVLLLPEQATWKDIKTPIETIFVIKIKLLVVITHLIMKECKMLQFMSTEIWKNG